MSSSATKQRGKAHFGTERGRDARRTGNALGDGRVRSVVAVERFRLGNGLELLSRDDHGAPVVAYQTWFGVGSRHEKPGKTGIAHLFEHLMFNETENLPPRASSTASSRSAGGESNAATWVDWTYYRHRRSPRASSRSCVELEAERMSHLVLREPQVESENEVVANERR